MSRLGSASTRERRFETFSIKKTTFYNMEFNVSTKVERCRGAAWGRGDGVHITRCWGTSAPKWDFLIVFFVQSKLCWCNWSSMDEGVLFLLFLIGLLQVQTPCLLACGKGNLSLSVNSRLYDIYQTERRTTSRSRCAVVDGRI